MSKDNAVQADEPDYEAISKELYARVRFAVLHLNVRGAGLVALEGISQSSLDLVHWKDWFADGLEMMPGVTVDRNALHGKRRKK